MAGLNLVPNPTLIAVQAGIFFTSIYVVKKLFLNPYSQLREKRLAATVGSKDAAVELLKRNDLDQQKINKQISGAIDKARGILVEAKQKASDVRQNLVGAAERDAKAALEKVLQELKSELVAEKAKVPASVKELSGVLFAQLMR